MWMLLVESFNYLEWFGQHLKSSVLLKWHWKSYGLLKSCCNVDSNTCCNTQSIYCCTLQWVFPNVHYLHRGRGGSVGGEQGCENRHDTAHGHRVTSWRDAHRVDSSYNIQTNVSVRRGFIWGINVHSIHKGEVLFFSSVYIQKGYKEFQSKGKCTKGGPKV